MPERSRRGARAHGEQSEGSNRFLETLIGNLPGMVYRCDNQPDWPFGFVSEGCRKITGWSSADFLEHRVDFGQLIVEEERPRVWEEVQAAVAARRPYLLTYRIRSRDGRERWLWEKGCGVFAEDGALECLEGVILDISQQHALEQRLLQAHKLEAVGRLAGGVAHEFNNLLTAILGYGDMLTAQLPEGGETQRQAQRIVQAAQRAGDLTRRLLSFSRRQPAEPRVFDLSELVLSLDPMLHRLVGEDVELVTLLARDVVPVEADPGQLEQVLVHLLVNARQAMPAGGKLTVEVQRDRADGRCAALVVSDTGSGIEPEHLESVFEPFFAGEASGSKAGLGLAYCREIVGRAGGTIEVESERGHGSRFHVRLPLAHPASAARLVEEREEPARGRGETVLVVEDEPLVRHVAAEALQELGYHVLVARSGGEALEIARRGDVSVDVLVADVVLPRMGGAEVARHMRELQPRMGVLLVSGHGQPTALPAETGGGHAAFLPKPFTTRSLGAAVRRLLERSPAGGSAARG